MECISLRPVFELLVLKIAFGAIAPAGQGKRIKRMVPQAAPLLIMASSTPV
jgi:hypothetical protein